MFELDSRLENDTVNLGDFDLCRVLLMNDSQYPWCILVPRVKGLTEIHQLNLVQREQLSFESNLLAKLMSEIFKADKMNTAALGNVVSQLHIHHIARYENDIAWPAPVWGVHPVKFYKDEELLMVKTKLLDELNQFDNFIAV